ncbi:MAG: hypothetical protein HS104_32090 [Polyangiaceae bacterium]|nr:hypothetical protein [Polyangiaceae bacterium]
MAPVAALQSSMLLATVTGSFSSSATASSQVAGTSSTVPLQSSSFAVSPLGVATSIAPGFTLASQSLQSPSATVKPSLS